jgi:SsrA-binding protein
MILAENRGAYHQYEIIETWDAGLVLYGPEVKVVRQKQARLNGSYVKIMGGNAILVGSHIPNYKNAAQKYDPERSRQLLLTRREIARVAGYASQKGYAVIPLKLYTAGSRIKLELGLGRGLRKYDQKAVVRERDLERDLQRELKESGV